MRSCKASTAGARRLARRFRFLVWFAQGPAERLRGVYTTRPNFDDNHGYAGLELMTAAMRRSRTAAAAASNDEEIDMDVAFLLLTVALSAITIGLIFSFERLRGRK